MDHRDSDGRFLPSRVYSRWKWTVRFGLLIVPMLVLLSGGLVLFLTPSKYRSTALVEFENARTPQESAKLLKSSAVFGRVIHELNLADQWKVDQETARNILAETVQVKVIPDTRLIEIAVTFTSQELARDIAVKIPRTLVKLEGDGVRQESILKISKLDQLIEDARDASAEAAVSITKIEKIHGADTGDAAAQRDVERVRRTSLVADAEVERLRVLRADATTVSLNAEPRLIVHTEPAISDNPSNPKIGPELDDLLLQALAAALGGALLLPYLCEGVFPLRKDGEIVPDMAYNR